jgi:hypothetical protein
LPISRQQFEQIQGEVIQSTEYRIQEFLAQNRELAFTPLEILQGIFPGTVVDPMNDPRQFFVEAALDSLLTKKAVVGKKTIEAGYPVLYFVCS